MLRTGHEWPSSDPSIDATSSTVTKQKSRQGAESSSRKRRCISTACIACRKRKSKCDGAHPSCAACASVYRTECIYDPTSDHRRKGVYRGKVDCLEARSSTLQVLVEAIINASEEDVSGIVQRIRGCDSLDDLARQLANPVPGPDGDVAAAADQDDEDCALGFMPMEGEKDLARKMGELRLENGLVRFIGGTSHLIHANESSYLGSGAANETELEEFQEPGASADQYSPPLTLTTDEAVVTSWTRVTTDVGLISHLLGMYFTYHYAYFTTLSKKLFWRDFRRGAAGLVRGETAHCSPLLVNAMLALGCHFTDVSAACATPGDSRTKGDHFFAEAKRLILADDEFEKPCLATVQALALMSVREAGCARESKGWVYSGMSFRMAQDLGLNLELDGTTKQRIGDDENDARKVTFWGCFLFDKCWSNYLGRLPQLPRSTSNVSKFDVLADEDLATWSPLTDTDADADKGHHQGSHGDSRRQPWRTRAAALQLSSLCEISSDLLIFFYHPNHIGRSRGKTIELKKLGEIHQRLEEWRSKLPKEFAPKEGQLPNVILMHMFFHLQYIHLFRPFLKYSPSVSPLPANVSPRRICTANAEAISRLMRLYKKTYNLRQICNIAVYMIHSACTIHLLNLPEKGARRDIIHGVKHLEEIAEDWLCARRTLSILSALTRKWNCELPDDASFVLRRTDDKFGYFNTSDVPSSPGSSVKASPGMSDVGLASTSHGGYSHPQMYNPSNDNASRHLKHVALPAESTIDIDHRAASVVAACAQQQSLPMPNTALEGDIRPDLLTEWNVNTASAPLPVSLSPLPLVSGGGVAASGSNHLGMTRTGARAYDHRQMSSGKGLNVNGQQWILDDSVRWQHNFNGWDLDGTTAGSSMFAFDGSTNWDGRFQPTESDTGDQAAAGFDVLGASLSGGSWPPNLD
ncbi:pathway-specific nitrogen regulator [Drechmeria coniospora]|uniref:Pathway-specific nitrogen regulator n=1 Tax=Drechmeria coniospora TaxID=98403 RepID=A0A151GRA2_DRECN|nr:pathway-specific nitrogen regulator [Drechmeria coniospora]KYK59620.1 pathway-specific nitrogen regulator [Drechmeria coniospora]